MSFILTMVATLGVSDDRCRQTHFTRNGRTIV